MNNQLRKAMSVVEQLPNETQEAIAAELMATASFYQGTNLSDEQIAEVDARLSQPHELASPADVAAVFAKY